MEKLITKYLDVDKKLSILDVGSYDVNGTYKKFFNYLTWEYIGIDIEEGPNVDVVAKAPYNWGIDQQFDVVISGQCIEHVPDVKLWFQELDKVVKVGGLVFLIAPNNNQAEHRFPVDCWRIFPDGMKWLFTDVGDYEVLECFIQKRDCVGVGRKISSVYYKLYQKHNQIISTILFI